MGTGQGPAAPFALLPQVLEMFGVNLSRVIGWGQHLPCPSFLPKLLSNSITLYHQVKVPMFLWLTSPTSTPAASYVTCRARCKMKT